MSATMASTTVLNSIENDELELRKTAQEGDLTRVTALLSKGKIDVNATGTGKTKRTALHWAAKCGHVQVSEVLLKAGARSSLLVRDSDGKTPSDLAALAKDNGQVTALLLQWSGLGEDRDKKMLADELKSTNEIAKFNYNKLRPAIYHLKKSIESTIIDLHRFYKRYKAIIVKNEKNIKKQIYKTTTKRNIANLETISKEDEIKLNQEFARMFQVDLQVNRHIDYLSGMYGMVESITYLKESITGLYIANTQFKKNINDFKLQIETPFGQGLDTFIPDKTELKKCKKYIDKIFQIVSNSLEDITASMEKGFASLLVDSKGFIEYLNKYFSDEFDNLGFSSVCDEIEEVRADSENTKKRQTLH